ncbi:hypothetical protein bwei_3533 [Bacillus mycoides]|nr:hypothetical protein bwei_3533 [Bacillus mycoides]
MVFRKISKKIFIPLFAAVKPPLIKVSFYILNSNKKRTAITAVLFH